MVPADPGQALAVRGRSGERVEVRAGDQLADGGRIRRRGAVERDPHDGPGHLVVVMPLLDAPHLGAVGGEREVGVTERRLLRDPARLRGQRARIAAAPAVWPGRLQQVEPLISVVREDDCDPAAGGRHRQVGQPAVLVHPGPGVPRLGQQGAPPAVRTEMHDRHPPALGRQSFLPPHVLADRARVGDQPLPPGHVGGGDGGGPGAVGECRGWRGRWGRRALSHGSIVYHSPGLSRKFSQARHGSFPTCPGTRVPS